MLKEFQDNFQAMTNKISQLDNKIETHLAATRSSTPDSNSTLHPQSPVPPTNKSPASKRSHSEVDPSSSSAESSDDQIIKDQQAIHSTMNVMSDSLAKIATFMGLGTSSDNIKGGDVTDDEDMEFSEPLGADESF